jgi:hypothetical protein
MATEIDMDTERLGQLAATLGRQPHWLAPARDDLDIWPAAAADAEAAGSMSTEPGVCSMLRDLAATGELQRIADSEEARALRSEAFQIVFPLVWGRHTRLLEARKGHRRCATGICGLEPECADGFTDDVEAVVTALLAYRRPIANLEGWITVRMANAIKDGYRQRRAREMGAQQRVRVPVRVAARLDNDPWMVALAGRVLQWVGVRRTAGTQIWPLGAWAEDRAESVGWPCGEVAGEAVAADLVVVLRTMQEWDPVWYATYVERPLGRKWAPVAPATWPDPDQGDPGEATHLELEPQHERDDARLIETAAACLAAIRSGIAAGADPHQIVAAALAASFLSIDSLCEECDRIPLSGNDSEVVVTAVLAEPEAFDRVVVAAMDIVAA